jgi:hypothetical protein
MEPGSGKPKRKGGPVDQPGRDVKRTRVLTGFQILDDKADSLKESYNGLIEE